MDDFFLRALLAGLGVALVTAPLGCFIVWKRLAYFGDTLSHAALLGVALGLLLNIQINLAILVVAVASALILLLLQRGGDLGNDTLLGILAHSTLSIGLVVLAFAEDLRVDLMAYLFGDILAVGPLDLVWIWAAGAALLALLALIWRPLLASTVHADLANVEGVAVERTGLLFMLMIATVIAISMKIIGVLLITSMLIIPPATARRFSQSPEQMVVLAALIGCISVVLGLAASWHWDTPAGPSIVVAASLMFVISQLTGKAP